MLFSDLELADRYYQEAEEAYGGGNCINASEMVKRAQVLYIKVNHAEGRVKTTELIGDINRCLKDNGDGFYATAMEYYNKKIIEGYNNCIIWATKAKEQYSHIPNPVGMNKCDQLIQDAKEKIYGPEENADELYEAALKLYESEDLINAPIKAKDALDKYTEINDTKGISKCNALLSAMGVSPPVEEAEINYRRASGAYKKATETNSFDDYMEAIEYAEKAKELFDKAGNKEGYAKSRDLLTLINSDCPSPALLLDKLYDRGMAEFLHGMGAMDKDEKIGHFNNATKSFENAKTIYYQLYTWAKEIKDYNVSEKKKKLYYEKLQDCDKRLKEIENELNKIKIKENAEVQYVNASAFFIDGDCKNASRYAKEAKSLFEKINDQSGVYKCDTFIHKINECLKKLKTADKYYENAIAYYKIADPENATKILEKAIKIYEEINNKNSIKKCNSLKKEITAMGEKKENADRLIGEAEMYFEQERFEDSIKKVEDARKIYEEIDYIGGVSKADRFIERVRNTMNSMSSPPPLSFHLPIIIAILLILTIAIFLIPPIVRRLKK